MWERKPGITTPAQINTEIDVIDLSGGKIVPTPFNEIIVFHHLGETCENFEMPFQHMRSMFVHYGIYSML